MNIRAVLGLGRQGQGDTFRSHKGAYRSAVKGVWLINRYTNITSRIEPGSRSPLRSGTVHGMNPCRRSKAARHIRASSSRVGIIGLLKFYNLFLTASRVSQNKKPANKACIRWLGLCGFYSIVLSYGIFLLPSFFFLAAGNANRYFFNKLVENANCLIKR